MKKNQMEILKLKSTMMEINSLQALNRFVLEEEYISNLEDISVEFMQSEEKKKEQDK